MRIEYITHASLWFQSEKISLLTDPFYFFEDLIESFLCHFPARELTPEYFGTLDYVTCSHAHDDHCHKKTMMLLKDKIKTVVLPEGKKDLEEKIRSYGFRDFLFLANEKSEKLPDGTVLTAYHDKNGVDTALVIESDGLTFLHQNDCRLDAETFRRLAERFKIDWAFVPHTGNQELFPLILPRPEKKLRELSGLREERGVTEFLEYLKILKPRIAVPYSFTVAYHNRDQILLNGYNRTTPVEFADRVKKEIPEQPCFVMEPGDILDPKKTPPARDGHATQWGKDLQEYLMRLDEYCRRHHPDSGFDLGAPENCHEEFLDYWKKRFAFPFPDFLREEKVMIHVLGEQSKRTYVIDVARKTAREGADDGAIFMEITLPAILVVAFLSRQYDSFMILYSYRIRFELNAPLGLTDEEECHLYIVAIMSLFDYETYRRELAS